MAYVICKEMGRLTLFHYFLATDGKFYVATNSAMKFDTKNAAHAHGRTLLKVEPELSLYSIGPRKGQSRIK